jgi:TctA family transporter
MQSKKRTTKKTSDSITKGKKGGLSTVAPVAAGAVVGAALGGATVAALTNEKTRKTITEVASNLGEYANDAMEAVASPEAISATDKTTQKKK